MPLKVSTRKGSKNYRIRGTVAGVSVDRSAQTSSHSEALAVAEALAARLFRENALGIKEYETFAELALDYIRAGHDLGTKGDEILTRLGLTRVDKIGRAELEQLSRDIYPTAKPGTINRWLISPVSACLHWGADAGRVPYRKYPRLKVRDARTDWRRPAEIERILAGFVEPAGRALAALYVGTGMRASEGVFLDGRDLAPDLSRVTIQGEARQDDHEAALAGFRGTKSGRTRTVPIPPRARELIAPHVQTGPGRALLNSRGEPWSHGSSLKKSLTTACRRAGVERLRTHGFRHTFATWHYAVHGDLIRLMSQGGWSTVTLLERYTHAGDDKLKNEIIDAGWASSGQSQN